jgi:2-dehydro-3-deoxyglucarate aldolase
MSLKKKLKNNQLTIGSWITIGHPSIVEIMSSARFEWLVIDMEHTTIDLTMAQILISTIQSNNMKALVRVSKNEEVIIKRILDAGADGIIVPMVKSKDDALELISYAKYPPIGKRGVGLYRAQKYGIGFNEYKQWVDDELVIIAQIEHYKAVENIQEIINVNGIDAIIIGPYDLSGSMGFPGDYHRDDVKKAIETVLTVCKNNNIPSGFHVIESNPEKLQQRIDEGCTFLAYSLDFFFLGDKAREGMNLISNINNKKDNNVE